MGGVREKCSLEEEKKKIFVARAPHKNYEERGSRFCLPFLPAVLCIRRFSKFTTVGRPFLSRLIKSHARTKRGLRARQKWRKKQRGRGIEKKPRPPCNYTRSKSSRTLKVLRFYEKSHKKPLHRERSAKRKIHDFTQLSHYYRNYYFIDLPGQD